MAKVPQGGGMVGVLLLAFVGGCARVPPPTPLDGIELQIAATPDQAAWKPIQVGAELPGGDAERVWLRVHTPALGAPDPALLVGKLFAIYEVRVDGRPIEPVGLPHVIPLPGSPAVVELHGTVYRVPTFTMGSQRALWTAALRREAPELAVGGSLVLAGVLLLAATLRRGAARAHRGLGLFLGSLGVITLTQLIFLRSIFLRSGALVVQLHEAASLLYPLGFADFALGIFGDGRRRVLTRGLRAYGVYAALAVALFVARPSAMLVIRLPINLFMLVFSVYALALAVRQARAGDGAARAFLVGIGALIVVALPDIADGLDLISNDFQTVPYGVVAFGVAMAVVIERRLAHTRDDLAEKVVALGEQTREVGALNAELRHQIAERSKQLAEALRAGISRPGAAGSLTEGQLLDGRYRVRRALGRGGMGAVFEVERLGDGRRFALKVMAGQPGPTDAVRFAREAEIAARLADPHLVAVVDVGAGEGGLLYLVMELVDGQPLSDLRERFGDASFAVPVLAQIAAALVTLHRAGVVHRDLKPANVLVARRADGAPLAKLSDFGISRFGSGDDAPVGPPLPADTLPPAAATGDLWSPRAASGEATAQGGAGPSQLTETGALMGTPAYMAPELAHGARRARSSSDVFAFGLMAYELLAARPAFPAPPVLLAMKGALPPVAPLPPSVDAALAALVQSCLDPSPELRPSAEDAVAVLAAAKV